MISDYEELNQKYLLTNYYQATAVLDAHVLLHANAC